MDYEEEQKAEIEALESIYYGDVEIISTTPNHKFTIPIKSEDCDNESEGKSCDLTFTLPSKYPDEIPLIELQNPKNLDTEADELLERLIQEAKENLGMAMIFNLTSVAQEWINNKWEEEKAKREIEHLQRQKEAEEAERKKMEGTKVTIESFLKWKAVFEEEMGITLKRQSVNKEGKKLTGRELFMMDHTLNESDLKFLAEEGNVKVDESLFQDLDDLDLDDEDDEDYDPNKSYESDDS